MHLTLYRKIFLEECTLGELFIDGVFECFTLEDKVREIPGVSVTTWKIPKITAIPVGTFEVKITFSNRFQKLLPQLMNVPGFEGIRIHSGNTAEDTEGCILVGSTKSISSIAGGKRDHVLEKVQNKIQASIDIAQQVFISVVNDTKYVG